MIKNEKSVRSLSRQCAAMFGAQIIDHGVIFTLFGVYSFGTFFHSYK
jgi:hypothetical protein